MANGYQFPYGFQQGNILARQRPTATSFFQAAQQGKFGLPKPFEPQSSMLAPTMAAIASRTTQPLSTPTSVAMPTAPLARTSRVPAPLPRPEGMPQVAPKTPSGLDQLRAAQLRMPARGTPADAGLRAAASTGLQLSGYQDRPMTLGQGLGAMYGAYTEAEQAAAQRQADAQQQEIANQLAYLQLQQKAMPDVSKARQAAIDIGLDPDSPEGQQWMREFLMKSSGGVTVEAPKTESAYQAELGKYAVTRLQGLDEELTNEQTNIIPRLNLIEAAIEGGVETGAGSGFFLDVKRIANAMGVLPSNQIDELGDQELVQKTISYLIPRYRVAGSGSTSDMEINLFAAAVPSLSTSTQGNLMLIKGMKQMSRFKKQYRDDYMDYLRRNEGDPTGFELEFEQSGASPFYSPESNEELNALAEKGFIQEGDIFYDNVSGGFQIYG
jgi:hypothetical protein